eukprot:1906986-Pyramimonas_sp.AAC.1
MEAPSLPCAAAQGPQATWCELGRAQLRGARVMHTVRCKLRGAHGVPTGGHGAPMGGSPRADTNRPPTPTPPYPS